MVSSDRAGKTTPASLRTHWLDTNVILRFLLNDHDDHSPKARALIKRAESGELTLKVPTHILCEAVYVLEGLGHSRASICDALTRFGSIRGIALDEPIPSFTALIRYRDLNVDFSDALLYSIAAHRGDRVWTFNKKHFQRMGPIWQEP
jgi:predicted nucleic acid-binding protein